MRNINLLWFILWEAIGFGTGWSLIGIFQESMFFAYFFAGAIGGATLGLALRDWKRAIVLTLLGSIGFGIGGGVVDILKQPLIDPGSQGITFWWAVLFMVIQGAIGGAALGAILGYLESRKLVEDRRPRVV